MKQQYYKILLLVGSIIYGMFCMQVFSQTSVENNPKKNIITIYEVKNLDNVNGENADFSPVLFNNKLLFTTVRNHDLVNDGESRYKIDPYELIYYSTLKKDSDSISYTSPILYGSNIDIFDPTGPICFNKSGNQTIFTMKENSIRKKASFYLFSAKIDKKGNIKKARPLSVNKKKFNFKHPTLSDDGQYLFFASDLNDGQGGYDLYFSEKNGSGWKNPENMGHNINTSGDELFPFIYKDSTLYFASNGHGGKGGFDIFSAKKVNGEWTQITPLDSAINTAANDYSIFFNADGETGYFASSREGGKGMADIYSFSVKYIEQIPTTSLAGKFQFSTMTMKVPEGFKVYLIDDKGEIAYTTIIDEEGKFKFDKLLYNSNYMIKIDEDNPPIDLQLIYSDSVKLDIIAELINNKKGFYVYKKLTHDQITGLNFMQADNPTLNMETQQGAMMGQFKYTSLGKNDLQGFKVYLVDDKAKIMFTTTTDNNGKFMFQNLPFNNAYIVKIDEYNPDIELYMLSDGEQVATLTNDNNGKFVFVKMHADAVNVLAMLNAEDAPIVFAESKINKEDLLYSTIKTETQSNLTKQEEQDGRTEMKTEMKTEKISSSADKGAQTATIYYEVGSSYYFADDVVFFDDMIALMKTKPELKIEINGYADTRESEEYNLWLSERRANKIKEYFISKGIVQERIKEQAFGEKYLAVECEECTEEQHQKNRRVELKVY